MKGNSKKRVYEKTRREGKLEGILREGEWGNCNRTVRGNAEQGRDKGFLRESECEGILSEGR